MADLGEVFDAHMKYEFVDHDVDATMQTMVANPSLLNVPTLAGGEGAEGVRAFYERYFVGKMPKDTTVTQISRTVGSDRVVDEVILSFTHDVPLDYMLPGIPPTGKFIQLPHVVVVTFQDGKIVREHIYWDQACLLVQIGLLDPQNLPVVGKEQAQRLLSRIQPSPATK